MLGEMDWTDKKKEKIMGVMTKEYCSSEEEGHTHTLAWQSPKLKHYKRTLDKLSVTKKLDQSSNHNMLTL